MPGSAAARSDLKRGDIITAINGRDVQDGSHEEIVNLMLRSGDSLALTMVRSNTAVDNPAAEFTPPPLFVPRTNFSLTELPAIANECLDINIQTQLEKRFIGDIEQTLRMTAPGRGEPSISDPEWIPADDKLLIEASFAH